MYFKTTYISKSKKKIDSKLSANGHSNSQHCWVMLVWQMLDGVGSDVQTHAILLTTTEGHAMYCSKDTNQQTSS